MSKIAVLILAAGSSSRMGRPKQLLKWKKTTLLQKCINQAKKSNGELVLVVLGANYQLIRPQIDAEEITILHHKNWENGLGSSIAFGVRYIQHSLKHIEGALIMLADQPLINAQYLNLLMENYRLDPTKIVASLYPDNKIGVPAIFGSMYFEDLMQLNNDRGAKEILHRYSTSLSYVDAMHLVADIDTYEDYEKL